MLDLKKQSKNKDMDGKGSYLEEAVEMGGQKGWIMGVNMIKGH
jgi:hypothetical protein